MIELAALAPYGDLSLFAAYGGLGLVVGFVAGLLGVGGGLIIVPVLIMLLHTHGQAVGMEPQLALGTSLATILFTSLSSVRAHHRRGAVEWPLVRRIAPGIVLGTLAGAALAARMPATVLKIFFVIFLFYAAIQMWLDFKPAPHRGLPGRVGTSLAGGVIGVVSSWVGIGGGTLSVPFMLWHNVPLHRAIATSAAIGFPIAFAGAVGYVLGGWTVSGLPAGSLGFVYLPALAGIVLGSVLTAPLGARTAHRLPVRPLKRVFALLLFTLALRMVWTF
ncbi:MAG: sulfite exporter TauE/SafE family protein [Thiobacillus sp.]|nr:sulfite exporter TauE/SafE family protein [Thiobacillus sp.]